ncbi:hypothetical protein DespoDRAFT_01460 [Desulfobacter postgatei 2ac9]|uniref:Uncharacterized protein n=1 Tax=Desulfobacter postgatei 2ac9 TaxID=879212 RepID=I5B1P1_9BACT|nr:hypothetical protein DespoDRAFT_01460 [Desulfobacter postgatei 2ac9]
MSSLTPITEFMSPEFKETGRISALLYPELCPEFSSVPEFLIALTLQKRTPDSEESRVLLFLPLSDQTWVFNNQTGCLRETGD